MKSIVYLVLLFSLVSISFAADKVVITWGVNVEPVWYFKPASERFKKNIESKTNGKIEIRLFVNQYDELSRNHTEDIINGTYDIGQETVSALSLKIPELSVWEIPFIFSDDSHVTRYIKSKEAFDVLKPLKSMGIVPIAYSYSGGFLGIYGDSFDSFADLSGKTIKFETTQHFGPALNKMLAVKSTNEFSKDYLNNNAAGGEIILSTIREIADFTKSRATVLTLTNHRVISRVVMMRESALDKIPKEYREIFIAELKAAVDYERQLSIDDKVKSIAQFKKELSIKRWDRKKVEAEKERFRSFEESLKKQHPRSYEAIQRYRK